MPREYKDKIDPLIVNSPFDEPSFHWKYDWEYDKLKQKHYLQKGRRPAGYMVFSKEQEIGSGKFVELSLVNKIRPRIKEWRENGYPKVTPVTKELLEFWHTKEAEGRDVQFFFCQLEAIETLIWLKEADPSKKVGINIEGDGGEIERLCCKMATGIGKTYVMSMLVAWQILNKVSYPKDDRFSKNVLIVAPNLTVKDRLAVLELNNPNSYYRKLKIVPQSRYLQLSQGRVLIDNCQSLNWETEEKIQEKKSVDKRGAKSDQAYLRDVLGDIAKANSLLVINDEAHHAWRVRSNDDPQIDPVIVDEAPPPQDIKKDKKKATCWIEGLDRIHRAIRKRGGHGILTCFDFSATPFAPSKKKTRASYIYALFSWIVSDFGLTDAIESGLTKTPRFVVRDDGKLDSKTLEPKLKHIYNDDKVKTSLNRKDKKEASLPQLVRDAYCLLGFDWQETYQKWKQEKMPTPPVMISAVNNTDTADRIQYSFEKKRLSIIEELYDQKKTICIHSNIENSSKEEDAELREVANSVGQLGKKGEQIRHIISVAMLSEGWDCSTVTHIMGLRAFSSQLLCEQIVGRGLRRRSYELDKKTNMYSPEYVNVFGIPFAFLPSEEAGTNEPPPDPPKFPIFPESSRKQYEIFFPKVQRIDHYIKPILNVDFKNVEPLEISDIRKMAELATQIYGEPLVDKLTKIDLEKCFKKEGKRLETIIWDTLSENIYDEMEIEWKKKITKMNAMKQIKNLVDSFLESDKFQINPSSYMRDETKKTIAITMGMEKIVRKLISMITLQNSRDIIPIYDSPKYRSTGEASPWNTSRKRKIFVKTHMNACVVDSSWEATHAKELDRNNKVEAWVKNDHIGFEIPYMHEGILRCYRPDFIAKLIGGHHLVLEVKGKKREVDESKNLYMEKWIKAVNSDSENGQWHFRVSFDPTGQEVDKIIREIIS